jgi:hypothetical protein
MPTACSPPPSLREGLSVADAHACRVWQLATVSEDRWLRLWHPATASVLGATLLHRPATAVQFSRCRGALPPRPLIGWPCMQTSAHRHPIMCLLRRAFPPLMGWAVTMHCPDGRGRGRGGGAE